jgi:hypothetical protein
MSPEGNLNLVSSPTRTQRFYYFTKCAVTLTRMIFHMQEH